jgi:hypothetical protein
MGAVADRGDGGARRSDQPGDLAVRNFGMVADDPGDSVRLVLPLGDRRVARALGSADLVGLLLDAQDVFGIGLAAVDLLLIELAGADRIPAGQLGGGGIVGDRLNLEDVETAKFGDLLEGESGVVDQPGSGRVGHERLDH